MWGHGRSWHSLYRRTRFPRSETTMADDEPTLPMELPEALPKRSWPQRIKAVFTEPIKLPGWAAVLFVAIQVIPDWKSRFDFWLDVAKGTGGYVAIAAAAIASPYFTPSLLIAGLTWIVFAGEAPRGVQRHHWLRYVGWSIISICLTIVIVTVGYGALMFYVQSQVSDRDIALQKQYVSHPTFWHLTDFQRTAFGHALDEIPEAQRFPIQIECLPDAGSQTFTEDIGKVFTDHKWKVSGNCLFSNVRPDLVGLYIGLAEAQKNKKLEELPKNVQVLAHLLADGQISASFALDNGKRLKSDDFVLVVGNPP